MKFFWLPLLFSIVEGILLSVVMNLLNRNKWFLAVLLCILKFVLYIRGIIWLFAATEVNIIKGIVGFVFGFSLYFIFTIIRKRYKKK
ncbi:MAG: hypothetical protein IKF53_01580 [Clostridia bacterium]|nr:hypothetical protein [Clostridia bacterium]